ncbi:MAG: amidohydrolase family protein [Pirellulales bacterium]|nr:amidohydrolase family protein [Pirellulales bacterium]
MSRRRMAHLGCFRIGRVAAWALLGLAASTLPAENAPADGPPARMAIQADVVYVGNGQTFPKGVVLIENGRIRALGCDLSIPEDTPRIELGGVSITPGLIDANARLETADLITASRKRTDRDAVPPTPERQSDASHVDELEPSDADSPLAVGVRPNLVVNEQGSEVVPHTRVLDSLDLCSGDFDRLVRGGVTTVYASPDASAVIGPRGAVLRTAGPPKERVLRQTAAVKAVIGSEPSMVGTYNRPPSRYSASLYARRPNSRMGLTWVFRKAFYDAQRRGAELPAYGSDTASPEASEVLRQVRGGEVPLRIQARIQQDILTALRLTEEFDLRFTLEEATEAYRCLDELKARSVPVVFGPIYEQPNGIRARTSEARRSRYYTFGALLKAGIDTALSAQELREEDGLARQAMYAMRFGVEFDQALRAVTQTPARLLGLETELGTLEPGKRADLVVWSGRPFAATSEVLMVVIEGETVLDRRGAETPSVARAGGPTTSTRENIR